jgi:hypothetical protein
MTLRYHTSHTEKGNERKRKPQPEPAPEPQPIDTGKLRNALFLQRVNDNMQDMANRRQGFWLGAISLPCLS